VHSKRVILVPRVLEKPPEQLQTGARLLIRHTGAVPGVPRIVKHQKEGHTHRRRIDTGATPHGAPLTQAVGDRATAERKHSRVKHTKRIQRVGFNRNAVEYRTAAQIGQSHTARRVRSLVDARPSALVASAADNCLVNRVLIAVAPIAESSTIGTGREVAAERVATPLQLQVTSERVCTLQRSAIVTKARQNVRGECRREVQSRHFDQQSAPRETIGWVWRTVITVHE
jgi:hypothetical protein